MLKIVNAWHVIHGIVIAIVRMSKINQAREMRGAHSCRQREQHELQGTETAQLVPWNHRNALFLKHEKPGR